MQITEITVTYQETANLGNYSNVKPMVTLRATIESGDTPEIMQLVLLDQARKAVQDQIDQALEQDGQAPKYSTDPRFDVLTYYPEKLLFIVPVKSGLANNNRVSTVSHGFRLHKANESAAAYAVRYPEYRLFDCSDGNTQEVAAIIAESDARAKREQEEQQARREAEWKARQEQQRAAQVAPDDDDDEDYDDDEDDE